VLCVFVRLCHFLLCITYVVTCKFITSDVFVPHVLVSCVYWCENMCMNIFVCSNGMYVYVRVDREESQADLLILALKRAQDREIQKEREISHSTSGFIPYPFSHE